MTRGTSHHTIIITPDLSLARLTNARPTANLRTFMSRSVTLKSKLPTINFVFPPTTAFAFPRPPRCTVSTAIAVAAALRFPRFLLPALPFLTPPIAMGAGPEDDPPRAVFLAVDARFLPPTATRTEDFAARRLGAVLRVSLIMSSRDWSRFMAAMVGGFDREARSADSRAERRRGDGGDARGRGSRA